MASRCLIQLSYAIGVAEPLSIYVDTFGSSKVEERRLERLIPELVDLTPKGIIERLNLRKPIYEKTSAYGHFGRSPEDNGSLSWENTDVVDKISSLV